jgi:hypothetical protein
MKTSALSALLRPVTLLSSQINRETDGVPFVVAGVNRAYPDFFEREPNKDRYPCSRSNGSAAAPKAGPSTDRYRWRTWSLAPDVSRVDVRASGDTRHRSNSSYSTTSASSAVQPAWPNIGFSGAVLSESVF